MAGFLNQKRMRVYSWTFQVDAPGHPRRRVTVRATTAEQAAKRARKELDRSAMYGGGLAPQWTLALVAQQG